MPKLTPFLKWAGGKTWLAPKLAEMYEPYCNTHTWVEPFCGSLGATLGVMPKRAVLSDSNSPLINLYHQIDKGMSSSNYWNSKEQFEDIKRRFNLYQFNDEFSAKAFYYLNRTCFNGLCRFNQKGEFNVGYGKYKNPKLDHDFSIYRDAFTEWDFFNSCYGDTLMLLKDFYHRQHFIYADPPYDGGFTGYSGTFTWDDQVNLAEMLAGLDSPVVASNKATDRVIDLYKSLGFAIEYIEAPRRIACNGDRKPVTEMLATKNIKE